MSNGESKVWCCKEQYCIGNWNARSTNQGKLDVVKQEIARVNTDILGISELKCTGMDKFNSGDHYIYYCGEEALRKNGIVLIVTKESKIQYLDAISKMTEWYQFLSKPNNSTSQYPKSKYPKYWCQGSWSWLVLWRPTASSRTNTKKQYHFLHKGMKCKSSKSKDSQN